MVHSIRLITSEFRGASRTVVGTTGCGESFNITIRRDDSLSAAGLSVWYSDITCVPCKARSHQESAQ